MIDYIHAIFRNYRLVNNDIAGLIINFINSD